MLSFSRFKMRTEMKRSCTHRHASKCRLCEYSHCNTLQHAATHCNTLHHIASHCSTLRHTAAYCSTLKHTAAHCSTLQYTATHCNTLQYIATNCNYSTLQRTATRKSEQGVGIISSLQIMSHPWMRHIALIHVTHSCSHQSRHERFTSHT
jgi:hypothetical protein